MAASVLAGVQYSIQGLKGPKGQDEKIANATFALYASSASAGVSSRFICTAEAISKVDGGYVLLTAGHCTPANPEIPGDAQYAVATDIGGTLMPVTIVKAVMTEPLDFALLYLPTKKSFNVDGMESVSKVRIGDKVTDVNFALGLAKQYSHGQVGSALIHDTDPEVNGDFLVQMDGGPGSSGSGVLHDGKLIGIVIYGFNEGTIGMGVEPIDAILQAIPNTPTYKAPSVNEDQDFFQGDDNITDWFAQRGHSRPQEPRRSPEPRRPREPREPRGNRGARAHQGPVSHRRIDRNRDVRYRGGRTEVCFYGNWFYAAAYPNWLWSDDVYMVQVGPDVWEVIDFNNPSLFMQVVIVD